MPIYVKIIFDEAPQDISWYIADEAYSLFRVAVPVGAYLPSALVANDRVLVQGGGRYQFVISDRMGDGLGGQRPGSYEVFLGEEYGYEILASGAGNFGFNETTKFAVPCEGETCEPSEMITGSPTQSAAPTGESSPQTSSPTIPLPMPSASPVSTASPPPTASPLPPSVQPTPLPTASSPKASASILCLPILAMLLL